MEITGRGARKGGKCSWRNKYDTVSYTLPDRVVQATLSPFTTSQKMCSTVNTVQDIPPYTKHAPAEETVDSYSWFWLSYRTAYYSDKPPFSVFVVDSLFHEGGEGGVQRGGILKDK